MTSDDRKRRAAHAKRARRAKAAAARKPLVRRQGKTGSPAIFHRAACPTITTRYQVGDLVLYGPAVWHVTALKPKLQIGIIPDQPQYRHPIVWVDEKALDRAQCVWTNPGGSFLSWWPVPGGYVATEFPVTEDRIAAMVVRLKAEAAAALGRD